MLTNRMGFISLQAPVRHGVKLQCRDFSSRSFLRAKLQIGDRVLLRWIQGKQTKYKITSPLREDSATIVDNHHLKHKDIIGQPSNTKLWQISKDGSRRVLVSVRHPTLEEYTSLTPRRVAPIYATYASTIVSLLDVHVDPPSADNNPESEDGRRFEILEAGTGHGSLTLQLARAIAAANPVIPPGLKPRPSSTIIYKGGAEVESFVEPPVAEIEAYRRQRRAVIHTVDVDAENSEHAEKLIRSYRNGVYWPHIDFHTGNVKDWIVEKMSRPDAQPFLDIVLLDMPGVEDQFVSTISAIKEGGLLLAFAPQITQIAACVQEIVARDLGLALEKVVELGEGVSTGRQWDVRMAKVRNTRAAEGLSKDAAESGSDESSNEILGKIPPMVCRPIVGELTRGGGFIALWKKVE